MFATIHGIGFTRGSVASTSTTTGYGERRTSYIVFLQLYATLLLFRKKQMPAYQRKLLYVSRLSDVSQIIFMKLNYFAHGVPEKTFLAVSSLL